jgi:phasin
MAKDTSFEMPDMRAFAEKSVEQAKTAFDSFASAMQQAVNRAQSQAMSAQSGVREMGELAVRYSERNIAASFELAQRLMQAKDASEMAQIQSDYIKSQMQALTEQAQELGRQLAKLGVPGAKG